MDFIEIVRDIRKAQVNNRLVVFVGSGVSKNSGIPTWNDLIVKLAKKLGYNNCKSCPEKNLCSKKRCFKRYNFCQDDFLKIPQFFYNKDKSKNYVTYYKTISTSLTCSAEPNAIDDIIFRLLPHHIITTNYDHLLEKSRMANRRLYSVISNDSDLVSPKTNQYIIKMHGDIDDIENIVLKEDDYINYEHTHLFIQTYIKSLLVDHTFLFVGYSLNDYNLKQIIGWINYFADKNDSASRLPKNYIIQAEENEHKYLSEYYNQRNIFLLGLNHSVVQSLIATAPSRLKGIGKQTYTCLDCILNESNDVLFENFEKYLEDKYHVLDFYRHISFKDLISVYHLGHYNKLGETLMFYVHETFDKAKAVILSETDDAQYICRVLKKARIFQIQCDNDCFEITTSMVTKPEDSLFSIYLNNEYSLLMNSLHNTDNTLCSAYYEHVCHPKNNNCIAKLSGLEDSISEEDSLTYLLFIKLNLLYIKKLKGEDTSNIWKELKEIIDYFPTRLIDSITFFKEVFTGINSDREGMLNLLKEHEDMYMKNRTVVFAGGETGHVLELQAKAYDYYFYMKRNYLMLDHFSDPKIYFQPYFKSIFCTYYPRDNSRESRFLGHEMNLMKYKLNEYDLDMITKYTSYDDLKSWLNDYKVKKIVVRENVDICEKFGNFCKSIQTIQEFWMCNKLPSFALIISYLDLTLVESERIIESISTLTSVLAEKGNYNLKPLLVAIEILAKTYLSDNTSKFASILKSLIQENVFRINLDSICQYEYRRVVNLLSSCSNISIRKLVGKTIDSCSTPDMKISYIYFFRKILSKNQKKNYCHFLETQISTISGNVLFEFITSGMMSFNDSIFLKYLSIIEKEVQFKKSNPALRTYPDKLKSAIEACILLYIIGKPINIELLKPYTCYSDYLEFLLEPESFDYSKVDTSDYMWQNFFKHNESCKMLIKNKAGILNKEYEEKCANNLLTLDQYRITFGLLVDSNLLWKFGDLH